MSTNRPNNEDNQLINWFKCEGAIELWFNHGLDAFNRRVNLSSYVEEGTIASAIKGLYFLDSISSTKPIDLYISSLGGDEYEMFGLFDVIRTVKAPIHTVAIGKCMSAGILLVAAGEKGHRWSMPNTSFMAHEGNASVASTRLEAISAEKKHYEQINDIWCNLMEAVTSKDARFWKKITRKVSDTYFNADEAVELGIVDQIWCEK